MNLLGVFSARYRGFRIVDIVAVSAILLIALTSYAMKTFASAEDADTSGIETRIAVEDKRVRLLQAEIARLESPDRVERLAASYLDMGTPDHVHDIAARDLPEALAHPAVLKPKPAVSAASATPAAPAAPGAAGTTAADSAPASAAEAHD
ncbi:MAG TPA: hypothetical protein VG248_02935 [Caulobacteraceae bacterium]|jgi:hypothetical protein|nr:hypothetical protein [Caulobacteraceae bacterium]